MHSRRYPQAHVAGSSNQSYPPGQGAAAMEFQPGDFILTHSRGLASALIRFGQGLRFLARNRRYIWWSHAALIVSAQGDLIEAIGAGVRRSHISKYHSTDYQLVRLGTLASTADREKIVRYAEWALGQEYGWLTIISISCGLLAGGRFTFGFDGQSICSGLVARALERSAAIFDRSPSHIMPADLAKYFSVPRPPRGSSRGVVPRAPRRRTPPAAP